MLQCEYYTYPAVAFNDKMHTWISFLCRQIDKKRNKNSLGKVHHISQNINNAVIKTASNWKWMKIKKKCFICVEVESVHRTCRNIYIPYSTHTVIVQSAHGIRIPIISLNHFKYFPVLKINNALVIWCASVHAPAHRFAPSKNGCWNYLHWFFVSVSLFRNVRRKILEKCFRSRIEFLFLEWHVSLCISHVAGLWERMRVQRTFAARPCAHHGISLFYFIYSFVVIVTAVVVLMLMLQLHYYHFLFIIYWKKANHLLDPIICVLTHSVCSVFCV